VSQSNRNDRSPAEHWLFHADVQRAEHTDGVLVNLALGERYDSRVGLASLRSKRTATVTEGLRGSVYTTSLSQSEAMWSAAASTPPVASPILRYYALLQSVRAVIASSRLGEGEWQVKGGHGLTLLVPDDLSPTAPSLARVIVKPRGTGVAQQLAAALWSPLLSEPASLLDLIAALPHQSLLTGPQNLPPRPIRIVPNSAQFPSQGPTLRWSNVPLGLRGPMDSREDLPLDALETALAPYPSLSKLPRKLAATMVQSGINVRSVDIVLEPDLGPPASSYWEPMFLLRSFCEDFLDIGHSRAEIVADPSGLVLPSVGGNDRAQHPLVTWHLVVRFRGC